MTDAELRDSHSGRQQVAVVEQPSLVTPLLEELPEAAELRRP